MKMAKINSIIPQSCCNDHHHLERFDLLYLRTFRCRNCHVDPDYLLDGDSDLTFHFPASLDRD